MDLQALITKLNSLGIAYQIVDKQSDINGVLYSKRAYLYFAFRKIGYKVYGNGRTDEEALLRAACYLPPDIKNKL